MYGISHVTSTPRGGSTAFDGDHRHILSEHIFQRCCSTSPLRDTLFTCRRSPRLLSNGYYVLTEDSFLSDEDGNVTLSPSQTSVTYKENLVRIFRRRKKIRRSLASLFSLSASSQWLSSTIINTLDSSHVDDVDDPWPDKCSKPEASLTDMGNSDFSCEYNFLVPQGQIPASIGASLTNDKDFIEPGKSLCASPSCSLFMINGNEDTLNKAESNTVPNFLSQITALMVCLIISVCTSSFVPRCCSVIFLQSCHIFQNN